MRLHLPRAACRDGCVAFHTNDALNAGASREEITDTLEVAVIIGGGPSLVYVTHAMNAIEQFKAKLRNNSLEK